MNCSPNFVECLPLFSCNSLSYLNITTSNSFCSVFVGFLLFGVFCLRVMLLWRCHVTYYFFYILQCYLCICSTSCFCILQSVFHSKTFSFRYALGVSWVGYFGFGSRYRSSVVPTQHPQLSSMYYCCRCRIQEFQSLQLFWAEWNHQQLWAWRICVCM